ncbi:helix-turn-helix domain-containing protein [Aquimarina spinulae]|uniref:helix-turn-helix domain-containing protein n=1 Tax=Aquimarina spinulae TaxID=1192023 RepID=UPI000D55AA9E|nr:helix-turn-helix domain-containing protein [Aquimarina spinulae]
MSKITQIIRLVFVLFSTYSSFSQQIEERFEIPDSLKHRSYDEIYKKYRYYIKDTIKSRIYLKTYLEKARKDGDSIKMARAYGMLYYFVEDDVVKIKYLDESIKLSKNQNHLFYPAFPYSSKGGFYLNKWDYERALDNYLMALKFTKINKNTDFQYLTQHNIAIIKSKLGKHQEALDIFKKCLDYEEKMKIRDTLDYMEIIVDLAETYTKNSMIDSSDYYLKRGFSLSKQHNNDFYYRFLFNQGVNFYYKKEYGKAEQNIKESLPYLSQLEDKGHTVNAYFYLGKINESITNKSEANYFYKKIDSVFQNTRYITPEVRESYSFLINYYKTKKDYKNQLLYVERLLKFDSLLHQNNILVNEKMIKKYDTAELLAEKEKVIASIDSENSYFKKSIRFLIITVIVISALFYYQYLRKRRYSKRFNALIEEKDNSIKNKNDIISGNSERRILKISDDIKEDILYKIQKFEENLGFLETNITLVNLASKLNTNSKYLSKIINQYKEKSFSQYINDLRIEYLIEKLKTDKIYTNYTVKAIGEEIGFKTANAFSRAFFKKTGKYPSDYVRELYK